MQIIEHSTYIVSILNSNEQVELPITMNFTNDDNAELQIHCQLSSGMTVRSTNEAYARIIQSANDQNVIVLPIQIRLTLLPLINDVQTEIIYDLAPIISSIYGSSIDLGLIRPIAGQSINERKLTADVVFNDTENCILTVVTNNLKQLQTNSLTIAFRKSSKVKFL